MNQTTSMVHWPSWAAVLLAWNKWAPFTAAPAARFASPLIRRRVAVRRGGIRSSNIGLAQHECVEHAHAVAMLRKPFDLVGVLPRERVVGQTGQAFAPSMGAMRKSSRGGIERINARRRSSVVTCGLLREARRLRRLTGNHS